MNLSRLSRRLRQYDATNASIPIRMRPPMMEQAMTAALSPCGVEGSKAFVSKKSILRHRLEIQKNCKVCQVR